MGFGKAKYDVEEKGLDPRVGHKAIAADGRLDKVQQPAPTLTREEAEQKYLDMVNQYANLEPKDGVFVSPFSDEDYQFLAKTAYAKTMQSALDLANSSSIEDDGTEITLPVVSTEPIEVLEGENIDQIQAAAAIWTEAAHAEVVKLLEVAKKEAVSEVAESAESETVVNDIALTGTYSEEDIKDIEYVQKKLHADVKEAPKKEKKQAAKKPTKSAK